ncbi:MAG: rRNA maturation RNase YbeY [Antarcticimicrobium sp.]|uniref:rRNA maturation RNase YbeY n=1 Tax=Antarcticimicrobium sp. TaxID=2824147 RepID=UPI0026186DA6|nr:rRNA maturation RNase YbeY [Antarcticimicrobium sp.]MDF1716966.1 rRNA maturation RNase YbeY [Antarcticimicrobium sp.]
MTFEISVDDSRWGKVDLPSLAERAVAETLRRLGLDPDDCEVALLACDDTRIAELNADFRGKPQPTNVLSWPAEDLGAEIPGARPDLPEPDFTGEIALGDIAIAFGTCAREAREQGKSLADHTTHLIVHGLLHLLGYDHIRDPDATLMEGLEVEILGRLGLDDPYREQHGP